VALKAKDDPFIFSPGEQKLRRSPKLKLRQRLTKLVFGPVPVCELRNPQGDRCREFVASAIPLRRDIPGLRNKPCLEVRERVLAAEIALKAPFDCLG
jgi:hypothetical protein